MTETFTIEFTIRRCHFCGSYYAFETSRYSEAYTCPRCNHTRMREMTAPAERLQRSISALRGAITKLKKNHAPR